MLLSGRWLYVVFMCQQAAEKLSKGLYNNRYPDFISKLSSQIEEA